MTKDETCPICLMAAKKVGSVMGIDEHGQPYAIPQLHRYECPRCGEYSMLMWLAHQMCDASVTPEQRGNMSGWIHEHQSAWITNAGDRGSAKLDDLLASPRLSLQDQALRILLAIGDTNSAPGARVPIPWQDPVYFPIAWVATPEEMRFLIISVLSGNMGLLEKDPKLDPQTIYAVLSATGLAVYHQLKTPPPPPRRIGF